MADVELQGVTKAFNGQTAVNDVSFSVSAGHLVALLGPSGCGKSTTLRLIAGLEQSTAGTIRIAARDVTQAGPAERGVSMVFQSYALFPHLTVAQNILFGLEVRKVPKAERSERLKRAADMLGLAALLDRKPSQLSGGQQQRVALGRAIVAQAPVCLMDEPLSNLDALLRLEMRAELKAVLREARTTTIYVTHDQTEAMGLADRIAVMHGGRIEQIDRPTAVYERPATTFVGGFVGSPPMNFLPVSVENARLELAGSSLPAPRASGDLLMGIRAEDLMPVAAGEGLPFDIAVVEPLGAHDLVTGRSGATLLRVAAPAGSGHKPGTRIGLKPDPKRLVWMDPASGRAFPTQ